MCRRFFCFSVLFKRNAYMLRTPLSPLRVPRVTYVSVSSPRTSAGFADCLHLCVLTVTVSLGTGETRIYVVLHCRACVLPWSCTVLYTPCGKSAPFASCSYLRVLTVTFLVYSNETRYKGASCALTSSKRAEAGRQTSEACPPSPPCGFSSSPKISCGHFRGCLCLSKLAAANPRPSRLACIYAF